MIRFKQFIKESMDTIFPYERVRDDVQTVEHESGPPSKIRHIHHEITLPDESKIRVEKRIEPNHYQGGEPELNVKFFAGDSQKLTGRGEHQFGILNTVRQMTKETAEETGVKAVKFAYGDDPGSRDRERRHSVYGRMAARVGKELPPIDRLQRIKV